MKKILVFGGTQFIGRNLINRLIELGDYEITLFNRQRTGADLFPNTCKIKGDRTTDDIQQIANTNWDYVIDISCYHPNDLERTLACLNDNLERYIFISTCSVYDNKAFVGEMRDENAPILDCSSEQITNKEMYRFYGNKKAECERILTAKASGKAKANINSVILRPALVYGRFDYTDRFYYWLYQVKMKDVLLLPDNGSRLFSITYVDDLVNSIIAALTLETNKNTFNIISETQLSIDKIIKTSQKLLNRNNKIVNASPSFLHDNKISQWTTMPLWIDNDNFTYANQQFLDNFPIKLVDFMEATASTIEYYKNLHWQEPKYGMSEEQRLLLINELS
ncbi:MAG: NAD-dependent epimerase/dehydratase family protein [Saprospiraceae bacterium]